MKTISAILFFFFVVNCLFTPMLTASAEQNCTEETICSDNLLHNKQLPADKAVGVGTNCPGGDSVLIIAPYDNTERDAWMDDTSSRTVGTIFADALGGELKTLSGEEATNDAILEEIFSGEYAIIFINSHGGNGSFGSRTPDGGFTGFYAEDLIRYKTENPDKNLNNALVYSSTCSFMTGQKEIADKLLEYGAGVVIGDNVVSYSYSKQRINYFGCIFGGLTAGEAFDIAIEVSTFKFTGNRNWYPLESMKPMIVGESGYCGKKDVNNGENVAYEVIDSDNQVVLRIYPAIDEAGTDLSIGSEFRDLFGRYGIERITIEDGITSIGDKIFEDYSSVKYVDFADSVKNIGTSVFKDCTELTSVTIPEGVTVLHSSTFLNCKGLTSVTLPNGLVTMASKVFSGCSSLKSINIPEKIMYIGDSAFYGCSNLTSVTLPQSLRTIANKAFSGCSSLVFVKIPGKVENVPSHLFYDCSSLESVEIERGVKKIGEYAFANCPSLEKITIPDTVSFIDDNAFDACSKSLVICGYSNSYAEEYARARNLIFECLDAQSDTESDTQTDTESDTQSDTESDTDSESDSDVMLLGDVDGDEELKMADVALMQKHIAKLVTFDTKQKNSADLNGDCKISMLDVTMLQKYIANLIDYSFMQRSMTGKFVNSYDKTAIKIN